MTVRDGMGVVVVVVDVVVVVVQVHVDVVVEVVDVVVAHSTHTLRRYSSKNKF